MSNLNNFLLSFFPPECVPHGAVLGVLGRCIYDAEEILEGTRNADERFEERALVVGAEQCESIETFLGIAYVTLQAMILRATSSATDLHRAFGRKASAKQLRARGAKIKGFSKIEILWALANYFKHRDEWGSKWSNGRPGTVRVIKGIGLHPASTENLRKGAKVLGLGTAKRNYSDLDHLERIVRDWTWDLREALESEVEGTAPNISHARASRAKKRA